jgi:hypothetical protein
MPFNVSNAVGAISLAIIMQVHARTSTLAVNAIAQLDSIFAYISSHLADNSPAIFSDGQSASDPASPQRGMLRR